MGGLWINERIECEGWVSILNKCVEIFLKKTILTQQQIFSVSSWRNNRIQQRKILMFTQQEILMIKHGVRDKL